MAWTIIERYDFFGVRSRLKLALLELAERVAHFDSLCPSDRKLLPAGDEPEPVKPVAVPERGERGKDQRTALFPLGNLVVGKQKATKLTIEAAGT